MEKTPFASRFATPRRIHGGWTKSVVSLGPPTSLAHFLSGNLRGTKPDGGSGFELKKGSPLLRRPSASRIRVRPRARRHGGARSRRPRADPRGWGGPELGGSGCCIHGPRRPFIPGTITSSDVPLHDRAALFLMRLRGEVSAGQEPSDGVLWRGGRTGHPFQERHGRGRGLPSRSSTGTCFRAGRHGPRRGSTFSLGWKGSPACREGDLLRRTSAAPGAGGRPARSAGLQGRPKGSRRRVKPRGGWVPQAVGFTSWKKGIGEPGRSGRR